MLLKHAIYQYLPQRYHKKASFEDLEIAYKIHSFKDGRTTNIPASCQHTHARRFKKFSAMVCQKTHAENGYDYIHVVGKRSKAHISKTHELAENTDQYVLIDAEKLAGKNVVVFDDITTTCKTADAFIERIQQTGANVKLAIFLARTKSFKKMYN